MILKTAANYNDEGGYIEAWKKSDGTTEVKLIPKSGGGDDGKNGIKSVSISPAITTTPALDSLFPVYYEDLPEDPSLPAGLKNYQKSLTGAFDDSVPYTATVTPTENWYVMGDDGFGGKGEAVTVEAYVEDGQLIIDPLVASTNTMPADESLKATITISA